MAQTKVTVTKGSFVALSRKIKSLKAPIDRDTADKAGEAAVKAMLKMIRAGSSPIANGGKFPAYRGSYRDAIDRYGRVNGFSKSLRPVNLTLSGRFLDSLISTPEQGRSGWGFLIEFDDPDSADKEDGHRTGHNGQEKRPIIPLASEGFARPVSTKYTKIFRDRINKLLNKPLK